MSKIFPSPAAALEGLLFVGMTVMSGGLGLNDSPETLIETLKRAGVGGLTAISNDCGRNPLGLAALLESGQVTRLVASHPSLGKTVEERFLLGQLELEMASRQTLSERLMAGAGGMAGFQTRDGGYETALRPDLAILKAWRSDPDGNLMFRPGLDFDPVMATAARVTIVEVEAFVPHGAFAPDSFQTRGIYIDRIVQSDARAPMIVAPAEQTREPA